MHANFQTILPGFADPVMQSQQVFRQILDAMAHPGRIVTFTDTPEGPEVLSPAATAVCLALVDFETPIWLDAKAQPAADYLQFHCNCPMSEQTQKASFALIAHAAELADFEAFNLGSNDYPDRAATLIIEVTELANNGGKTLRGPGIQDTAQLSVAGVSNHFWQQVRDNSRLFPCGVDLMLTCGRQLAALPRTIQVEV